MSTNGKFLDRQINFGAMRKTKIIDVPEWGCAVILRELSIAEVTRLSSDPALQKDPVQQLALGIVDEQGQAVFTSAEDLANLSKISSTIGAMLIQEMARLNGATQEAIDEVLKNFKSRNGDSVGA